MVTTGNACGGCWYAPELPEDELQAYNITDIAINTLNTTTTQRKIWAIPALEWGDWFFVWFSYIALIFRNKFLTA